MEEKYSNEFIKKYSGIKPIKKISANTITYQPEYILSVCNRGLSLREFELELHDLGFPTEDFSKKYFKNALYRFKRRHKKYGDDLLQEKRGSKSRGRPKKQASTEDISLLSPEDQANYWKSKYERELEEKEILKKYMPSCMTKNGITTISTKVLVIDNIIQDGTTLSKSDLCRIVGLKKSTYYAHKKTNKYNGRKTEFDLDLEHIIKTFFLKRNKRVGRRQVKMYLDSLYESKKIMQKVSLNKIRRIMNEQVLVCKVRRKNPYKNMWVKTQEHNTYPNILDQQFKCNTPYRKLSTDITYLHYGRGKKAYLSAIKDLATGEIISFEVLPHLGLELSLNVIDKLPKTKLSSETIIHSDQGAHYTSPTYSNKLKKNNIVQSMSRKGHCLDNAPIESFFGHLKDECMYRRCQSFKELEIKIRKYIYYYNRYRFQWNKKKLTPIQYRNQLLKASFI